VELIPVGSDPNASANSTPNTRLVRWRSATRVVATRFPPINLYERVSADPEVWDALIAAEQMVNPQVRDAIGDLRLVALEEQVSGPGSAALMAPFTHWNPMGSRFSDGSYGVYYAGDGVATAVAETAYHFARIARQSADGPRYETMSVQEGPINASMHDLDRTDAATRAALLDPDSYVASRQFGQLLRPTSASLQTARGNGIYYPSVRRAGGHCIAVFRPSMLRIPGQGRYLGFDWDGERVRRYFDYYDRVWVTIRE
jgi:hypothetical protein